jgi:hypothetical protein
MKIKFIFILLFLLTLFPNTGCHLEDKHQPLSNTQYYNVDNMLSEWEKMDYEKWHNPKYSEGIVIIPSEWKESEKPDTDSDRWWYKFFEADDIMISLDNDAIIAEAGRVREGQKYPDYLEVENGTIVGFNKGEFGGWIVFMPNDGPLYEILNENFRGFYTIGDKIYVLTGLAHMVSDYGSIYELTFVKNKWTAREILDIGNCPAIFLLVNDELYIATYDDTLLIIKDGKISNILVKDSFFGMLHPNSMIYANNSIFIGMTGGVYMYDLDTGMDKWYEFLIKKGANKRPN